MKAMYRTNYGGPEQLVLEDVPIPEPQSDQVLIRIKAFGLNRAEIYMRRGDWGDVAKISGIECVGEVAHDPRGTLLQGQTIVAMMGGMGRTLNGSYAEYACVPADNVIAIHTRLGWAELAAIPESYATAWSCLHGNLALQAGETLLIRGASSALGQASINIARHLGVTVIASSRDPAKFPHLQAIGAQQTILENDELSQQVQQRFPTGIDAVLELVGNETLLDSMKVVRMHGRVCVAGFLGSLAPIESFNPLTDMPVGVQLSFFGSFVFGQKNFPLADKVPLQTIVENVEQGHYQAKPAAIFDFPELGKAHQLMESNRANGKIVVVV